VTLVPGDAEFTTLDDFPLRARFVARPSGVVPADLARRLKPLNSARAKSLAPEAEARLAATTPATAFRGDDAPFIVGERLRALGIAGSTPIVVWWSTDAAMVTEWSVFLERWGDFCYPAAGDVCVWPSDDAWTLCYRRYEVFQFRAAP
jgi:hypothetical protein